MRQLGTKFVGTVWGAYTSGRPSLVGADLETGGALAGVKIMKHAASIWHRKLGLPFCPYILAS